VTYEGNGSVKGLSKLEQLSKVDSNVMVVAAVKCKAEEADVLEFICRNAILLSEELADGCQNLGQPKGLLEVNEIL
jgi:hypothetical protein